MSKINVFSYILGGANTSAQLLPHLIHVTDKNIKFISMLRMGEAETPGYVENYIEDWCKQKKNCKQIYQTVIFKDSIL